MPTTQTNLSAVLTGDIVNSREVPHEVLDATFALLADAANEISGWFAGAQTRFTRFRGDGWQVHIDEAGYGLRAALYVMARLHADGADATTRVAIGVGSADSLGSKDLSDARGTAFESAGHALDTLGRHHLLAIEGQGIGPLHRNHAALIEQLLRRWSREQAEAMALYLHPDSPTLADMAGRIGISPQAVSYRLAGVGGPVLRRVLRNWEDEFERAGTQGRPG